MDDGKDMYRVIKNLYERRLNEEAHERRVVKSLCEENRYVKTESRLQKAGKKQRVYSIIHRLSVLKLSALAEEAEKEEVRIDELESIIADLKARGLIYEPEPGVLGCAGD